MIQKFSLLMVFLCGVLAAWGQTGNLRGRVLDADNNLPLSDASVVLSNTGYVTATEADGTFELRNLRPGKYTIVATLAGYLPVETVTEIKSDNSIGGNVTSQSVEILMKHIPAVISDVPIVSPSGTQPTAPTATADIPTVTLEEAESESEGVSDVANLLHANRDIFQNISSFGWSNFRFRERGYDGSNFYTLVNGIPFNDPETGFTFFGEFGGLNDVLRNRTSTVGMDPADFAFSEIGGATLIDTRASVQRKQIRASHAISNRTYRHRTMLTASTGLLPGGWAFTLSGSRRWGQQGYVEGTFFDGWSYFLSADKKFGNKHALNLTVLGAPTRRGRGADSYQEMFDIAGTNYYNPLWGFQNGEVRNSQTTRNHQPTAILRYDWKPSAKTNLTAAVYGQAGVNGFTRLNWLNGKNPAPDFNRRLPSSMPDTSVSDVWARQLSDNEALRQIDWQFLYDANRYSSFQNIRNANGQTGNTVSGQQAIYILEEHRSDNREAGGNLFFSHYLTPRITLNGGGSYLWYEGRNFKTIHDLLGADFWLDKDFFSTTGGDLGIVGGDANLLIPNHTVQEGDRFGYDYNEYIQRANAWGQAQFSLRRFQLFVGGEVGHTNLQREGFMKNGRFPEQSLGTSEKLNFNTYGVKGGIVYKMNGRNFLYTNGYYGTRAPQFRNAFVQPRLRNKVVPNLELSNIQAIEGGYLLRAPRWRARVTGYFTKFNNETESIFLNAQTGAIVIGRSPIVDFNSGSDPVLQEGIVFGSGIMQNIDRQHAGVELGIEAKPFLKWTFSAAANLGKYIYTSRPNMLLAVDNGFSAFLDPGLVYQKNFYVPRTPQTTGSFSVRYEGARFWFASLTLNYMNNMWYEFDRVRRTPAYTLDLNPNSPLWRTIIDQQKAPEAFTLDIFGGKSWRMRGGKYFLYLNVGVNNILNNQNITISGRESYYNAYRRNYAVDPRFYSSELLYGFGTNYFASIAVRI